MSEASFSIFTRRIGITFLFTLSYFFTLAQSVLEQKIELSQNKGTIRNIIQELQAKSKVSFAYSDNEVNIDRRIKLGRYQTIKDVLNQICSFGHLTYVLLGNKVILRRATTSLAVNVQKKQTISGYVKEKESGEALIGAAIYLPDKKTGTVTNTYGFYSITLPEEDSLNLIFSYVGKISKEYSVHLDRDIELNIELSTGLILQEVEVIADNQTKASESVQISNIIIPITQLKNVPALLGEKDVFKVIQLLPGVQKGTEGQSGIYVRGGGYDQNLIILDEAVVYNAFHTLGLFSLFNGDALKSMELIKGGFPARYGGRLSSVIEMNMKEGNKEKFHGSGSLGLISSKLTLEGPIARKKASFLVSGRRTYLDLLINPFLPKNERGGYYFYDFNGKLNYDFGKKNKLYLSGYIGRDNFHSRSYNNGIAEEYVSDNKFYWGNKIGNLRWNHLFNDKLFTNTSLIYTHHKFGINIFEKFNDSTNNVRKYISEIQDFTLKSDWSFQPVLNHSIGFGFLATQHQFTPSFFASSSTSTQKKKDIFFMESCLYIQDIYRPFPKLQINGGFRLPYFLTQGRQYLKIEPRISASYNLQEELSLKASYTLMNQYVHLLSNSEFNLPIDSWVPITNKVPPSTSQQISIGIAKDISSKNTELTLEGYYKKMQNIMGFKEGSGFSNLNNFENPQTVSWEDNITSGQGWSYGAEFFVQKKSGKFSGWIGYTLSWTQLQFDSLNFGKKFYARYDRRHDISLVSFYKLSERVLLSGTWVYGTGNSVTLPTTRIETGAHNVDGTPKYSTVDNYNAKNSFRMGSYHRLDIGIQFHKKKKWGERTWEVNVYNIYNRKNPFYYYIKYKTDATTKTQSAYLSKVSIFPIIPSISYSFKF